MYKILHIPTMLYVYGMTVEKEKSVIYYLDDDCEASVWTKYDIEKIYTNVYSFKYMDFSTKTRPTIIDSWRSEFEIIEI